jgi:hypothetical protein
MPEQNFWSTFGKPFGLDGLPPGPIADFASIVSRREGPALAFREARHEEQSGLTAVLLDVEVQRPQRLVCDIRRVEPIAILFSPGDVRPGVYSARDDFPETPHQNWVPKGCPSSLCVDDRPWPEAKLSYTPSDFIWRIETWLSKAARGELHDPAQPLDPIFLPGGDTLLLPAWSLADSATPVELCAQYRTDNPGFIVAKSYELAPSGAAGFVVVSFQLPPQAMSRMRYAPTTLGALDGELSRNGVDLFGELKKRLRSWAGTKSNNARRLSEQLIIIVQFPVADRGRTASDVRAFLTRETAGDVGVALGVLLKNIDGKTYSPNLMPAPLTAASLRILHAQVQLLLNREIAAAIAGHSRSDTRRAVLVGAGSLGSQVALALAREGMFTWGIIDGDTILPHNLARHGLLDGSVAAPKASALARELGMLLGENFEHFNCDVLDESRHGYAAVAAALQNADLIIDASASVAVSRHLSEDRHGTARRISVFFNPAGTSAVLLAEDVARNITLSDLEAQYYRLVLTEPDLAFHLDHAGEGIRYSGSCRAVTNRIPATRAALLSALVAHGIAEASGCDDAHIRIWTCRNDGGVNVLARPGREVRRQTARKWELRYDAGLLEQLFGLREANLPNETGGILLGIVDMGRKSIHLAQAMPQPVDSRGSVTSFERGVAGLREDLEAATKATMHQLRYAGEWHSHPRYASATPSGTDILQLMWLGAELAKDGVPGLMFIAGDKGDFRLAAAFLDEEVRASDDGGVSESAA